MNMLAVGDDFVPAAVFRRGLSSLERNHQIRYLDLHMDAPFTPETPSECKIREYAGTPRQLIDALAGEEMLLVHGAPVTDAVLDAAPNLRLVGVARGGPVNVDIEAASERGIAVLTAPGRNAEAVADLTLAFMIMLARGIMTSAAFIAGGGAVGESTFEGVQFFGHDLGGHVLGLIGYGNVGSRVARRARCFDMQVLAYDPYVESSRVAADGVAMTDLDNLLARADFVSLHLRATPETNNLFDAARFAQLKPGAFLINSARETFVDEKALYDAVTSGRLAGAALDVIRPRPDGSRNPLIGLPNVIITPHIGGATHEAALRGVTILEEQIERYLAGRPMQFVANPVTSSGAR